MARYEAMGMDVYDHQEHDFLTAQEIAEFFNAHDGMMTRFDNEMEKVIKTTEEGKSIIDRAIATFVLEHFKTVLNGGAK